MSRQTDLPPQPMPASPEDLCSEKKMDIVIEIPRVDEKDLWRAEAYRLEDIIQERTGWSMISGDTVDDWKAEAYRLEGFIQEQTGWSMLVDPTELPVSSS